MTGVVDLLPALAIRPRMENAARAELLPQCAEVRPVLGPAVISREAMTCRFLVIFLRNPLTCPPNRNTVMNGYMYLAIGALFIAWSGAVQTIFMDRPFVGHESALFRLVGVCLAVIGWLYSFGGGSDARQFGPASVLDRMVLVPAVLVRLAIAGIFPHTLRALRFSTLHSPSVLGCCTIASGDCSNGKSARRSSSCFPNRI